MKKILTQADEIERVKLLLKGFEHQIEECNNDPEFVKKHGKIRLHSLITADEFREEHVAGNAMWGAEDAPGPLANVRGVDKPMEFARQKMVDTIRNTETWKKKFAGRSPTDVISEYKSNQFRGHKV